LVGVVGKSLELNKIKKSKLSFWFFWKQFFNFIKNKKDIFMKNNNIVDEIIFFVLIN